MGVCRPRTLGLLFAAEDQGTEINFPHQLYVPIPFKLLFWIPSATPFGLEAKIHRFFAAKRIRNKGAGTEFFAMAAAEIHTLQPMQDTKPKASRSQIQRHLRRIGFGRPAAVRCSARTRR
jgi:hypothetical protein